jgi:hypothetical protein
MRSALATLGVTGGALGFPALIDGPGEEALPDGSAARGMITPKTDQAIENGLRYLSLNKLRDGSFGTNFYTGNTAVTSLAALAFMAAGYMPNRGQYGRVVTDALRFILDQGDKDRTFPGYLHNPNATPHGPMYGHGFATLFLAEAYGQVHDKDLRARVENTLHKAVKLILNSQNAQGGWRYTPNSPEADLSVTVCQIMALRGARNAGVDVPKSKVDKCVAYVKNCQDRNQGWFRYMIQGGGNGQQGFARTAAGVAALNSAGIYRGQEVEAGIRYLRTQKAGNGARGGDFLSRPDMHYFYGHYYAAQVMWTAGGKDWEEWFPAIRDELLAAQRRDGSWQDQICAHYATAMALLILQVPNNYLTIFQK